MPLRAFWLMLMIGCNAGYAGVFDDEEARRQIAAQKATIGEVRSQSQSLESRLVKLEDLFDNQSLLELHNQIESLKLDMNKLQGQIEVLVNENESNQKRQRDFYIDLDSRLRRIEQPDASAAPESEATESATATTASDSPGASRESGVEVPAVAVSAAVPHPATTPATATRSVSSAKSAESDAYEAAYSVFKSGSYRDAISRFNKFLKTYPDSSFTPSAHYWIGNSYYALRDFSNAIAAQERLIQTYPSSAKTPDAMLNIASSQQEMDKKTAAKKTLETLIAKYPGSEAADKAKRRLANKK